MKLGSVRELKAELAAELVLPPPEFSFSKEGFGFGLPSASPAVRRRRGFALGITRWKENDFRLAVRVQGRSAFQSDAIERIIKRAGGEVDVRDIGQVVKRSASLVTRALPMLIGYSVAHYKVTAGTLGCFVQAEDGSVCILSNNHVLANGNEAQVGDPILQPGGTDGGLIPADVVARLKAFAPLKIQDHNTVDCAIGEVESGIDLDLSTMPGLGGLKGPTVRRFG